MGRNTVATLVGDVATPLAVYFVLTTTGMPSVWALVWAGATSIAVLALRWVRSRSVSTLGVLVLVRFGLGLGIAFATGDARFVLAKDFVVTFGIAMFAAVSLRFERPFIARIRRDLSSNPGDFDATWQTSASFREEHRRLTRMWVGGLLTEVALAMVVIFTAPLDVAVVFTHAVSPLTVAALVAVTHIRGRRAAHTVTPIP